MTSEVESLAQQVVQGDRRALSRAITLVESTRPDHRAQSAALLDALLPETGAAIRIGVSGAPGAGKSTFIEALGLHVTEAGQRVAVLAVDPSSSQSGGSILGDKTRMEELSRRPEAFIRPSPSGGALGGVARRTREASLVVEAAGFDVIVIETVGVGQSETEVDDMVDVFVLLISPAGGDDLQGMKRGVTEIADVVVVTKADGDLLPAARQAAADYAHALHLLRRRHAGWEVPVLLCSSIQGDGVAETWRAVLELRDHMLAAGEIDERRGRQAVAWMWNEVTGSVINAFREDAKVGELARRVESEVAAGSRSALSGARVLLELSLTTPPGPSC